MGCIMPYKSLLANAMQSRSEKCKQHEKYENHKRYLI